MYHKITNDKEWVKKIKREHTVHDNKSYLICFPYAHFFFQHISDVPDTMNWVSVPNPDLTLTEKKASIEKLYWKLNKPPPPKKKYTRGCRCERDSQSEWESTSCCQVCCVKPWWYLLSLILLFSCLCQPAVCCGAAKTLNAYNSVILWYLCKQIHSYSAGSSFSSM